MTLILSCLVTLKKEKDKKKTKKINKTNAPLDTSNKEEALTMVDIDKPLMGS